MEFKDRLRELRLSKKLSQTEFGNRFNVIKQTVSSWETGNSRPDIILASEMADFFEVTTDYLLGRTDDPKGHKATTVAAHRIDDPTSQLPEEARKSIEDFKKFIFEKHGIKYD